MHDYDLTPYDAVSVALMIILGIYVDRHSKNKEKYPNAIDIESEVVPSKLKELTV